MEGIVLAALLASPMPLLAESGYSWLAYGDYRGQFEPCGCDPRTDLGGIQRLAGFMQRERAVDPAVYLLDLGNNISPPHPPGTQFASRKEDPDDTQDIKDRYIFEALVRLNPLAMLPGKYELSREKWMADEIRKLTASNRAGGPFPWVLSNLKDNAGPEWLRKSSRTLVKANGIVVFGFTWDKTLASSLLSATSRQGQKRLSILARNPELSGLRKVLLFNGPDDQLKAIIKSRLFDEIIASNRAADSLKPDLPDRKNEDRTLIRLAWGGMRVPQTQLGGQGILRGGKAIQSSAPSLESLLSGKNGGRTTTDIGLTMMPGLTGSRVSWLERDTLNPDVWTAFFQSYEDALRQSSAKRAQTRIADLAQSPYAGSQACKGCHAGAYDAWVKSKHSNAFSVLVEKGKNHDSECVSCHVLGATEKGGFVSQEASPHFMNVQCENCHGPRKDHAVNPAIKPQWIPEARKFESLCVGCHHAPHSPDFNYKSYWEKIAHGLQN
jgi:hypothetical protein